MARVHTVLFGVGFVSVLVLPLFHHQVLELLLLLLLMLLLMYQTVTALLATLFLHIFHFSLVFVH